MYEVIKDKRSLRKYLKDELGNVLNGKISHVKYFYWEGSGTVTEWADLDSFRINGQEVKTTQNDDFKVDFEYKGKKYSIDSVATAGY